jgi:adenylate cyclase
MRLNPLQGRAHPLSWYRNGSFFRPPFEDAAASMLLSLQEAPGWVPTYRFLASCYAHMGRLDQAGEAVARLRFLTNELVPRATNWRNPEHREFYLSGLRLAIGAGSRNA